MKIELSAYQARVIYMHLCALADSGDETLTQKEKDALESVILKLNKVVK